MFVLIPVNVETVNLHSLLCNLVLGFWLTLAFSYGELSHYQFIFTCLFPEEKLVGGITVSWTYNLFLRLSFGCKLLSFEEGFHGRNV